MSFDQARRFLAKVLPPAGDGYLNIHWTAQRPDRDRPFWTGRAVKTLDQAVRALELASNDPTTRDIYFCTSIQREATEKVSQKGYKYYTPIRSQQNVVALKALFIDIDVKPDAYPTIEDAANALKEFRDATGLPRPSVAVASGGGLHVYYTLGEPLPHAAWRPLAYALAEAVRRHGLKADTSCTIDSARVLRVPETLNRKIEPGRPVRMIGEPTDTDYSVEYIAKILESYKVAVPAAVTSEKLDLGPVPEAMKVIADEPLSESNDKLFLVSDLARECGFIRDALLTGGENYDNPQWNLTTLAATFCDEGREQAHKMGARHPGYTRESTDELYDRKLKERKEKGLGWPRCQTIQNAGCTSCAQCPHLASTLTPMHAVLAKPASFAPVPTTDTLPTGYTRDVQGIICRVMAQADGTSISVPLFRYPIRNGWLQINPYILNFDCDLNTGQTKQVNIPVDHIYNKEALLKSLSRQGVFVHERERQAIGDFFVSWFQTLQQSRKSVVESKPFGWVTEDSKISGFAFGGRVWSAAGDKPAANADPGLAQYYAPTGDKQVWIDSAKLITSQNRPALDMLLAISFGAPLMNFTGHSGLLYSAYSTESGIGKSTALTVAATVWGHPKHSIQMLDDTPLSVLRKTGETRHLPLYWDELKTDDDAKRFVKMVFQITGGREKSRLKSDLSRQVTGDWETALTVASNDTIVDHAQAHMKGTVAGIYRVFEWVVARGESGQLSPSQVSRQISELRNHYGQVGLEYSKFLGHNVTRINKDVGDKLREFEERYESITDERFWIAGMAAAYVGASYANELGFTSMDLGEFDAFLEQTLARMRQLRADQPSDLREASNIEDIFARYLNEHRMEYTLVTESIPLTAGKPSKNIKILSDVTRLRAVHIHIGTSQQVCRFSIAHFTDWLARRSYPKTVVMDGIKREFDLRVVYGRLGGGTAFVQSGTQRLGELLLPSEQVEDLKDQKEGDEALPEIVAPGGPDNEEERAR